MIQEITEGMATICDGCGKREIIHKFEMDLGGIDGYCYDCCLRLNIQ